MPVGLVFMDEPGDVQSIHPIGAVRWSGAMSRDQREGGSYALAIVLVLVLAGLYLTSLYSYLLFHTIAEMFSTAVVMAIFLLVWNARRSLDNNYLLLIGIAYLFIGGLDLIHTLAYKGMGIFRGSEENLPTQLWVAARYLQGISLLIAPLFIDKKLNLKFALAAYVTAVALLLGSIFYWDVFPVCYVSGEGLTPFKKTSEFVIGLILLAAVALLFMKRERFDPAVFRLLVASIGLTVLSELFFSIYIEVYGALNLLGHFLRIIACYFIYKAVVELGVARPLAVLFRNLKESEEALRKDHDFISGVLAAEDALLAVLDREGHIVRFNRACERLTGYLSEEICGRPFWDIVPLDKVDGSRSLFQNIVSFRRRRRRETALITKDGRQRWVMMSNSFLGDQDGSVEYVVVSGIDITERKKAEERLRESRQRLAESNQVMDAILQHTHMMAAFLDPEFNFIWVNRAYADTCKHDPSFFPGKNHFELYPHEENQAIFQRVVDTGEPFFVAAKPFEFPDQTQRGLTYWDWSLIPVKDAAKKVTGLVFTLAEVTDQIKVKLKLQEREKQFRSLVETTKAVAWELETEPLRVNYMSPRVHDLTGYPSDMWKDFDFWAQTIHPDDREWCTRFFQTETAKGKDHEFEYRMITADGRTIWIKELCTVVMEEGTPVLFRGYFFDITERKRSEKALRESEAKIRKLNETLERRVAKRTAELEERTRQLQALALELSNTENRERRQIASILHDDFQQQLAYMKLELGLIGKDNADKKVGQRLAFLLTLISDCINKSRNLSYELNPPCLNRDGLLPALESLAWDMKQKHGLEVTVRTQPGADPGSPALASTLYRSTKELLVNVVKHAGVNQALLDVGCQNGMIYIRVEDFGQGFNYETARIRQGRDGGFGLFSIDDRITFLGGSLSIKTSPGKGCRIVLMVPQIKFPTASDCEPPPENIRTQNLIKGTPFEAAQSGDDSGQVRILMVDDQQLMREALAKMLQGFEGLTVVGQAVNGFEAIQMAEQLQPDVILMDVSMPEMNGIEATAKILRNHPGIGIIGLSMHNDAFTRRKMLDAGAAAYLTKTGSPDILVKTILRVHHGNG